MKIGNNNPASLISRISVKSWDEWSTNKPFLSSNRIKWTNIAFHSSLSLVVFVFTHIHPVASIFQWWSLAHISSHKHNKNRCNTDSSVLLAAWLNGVCMEKALKTASSLDPTRLGTNSQPHCQSSVTCYLLPVAAAHYRTCEPNHRQHEEPSLEDKMVLVLSSPSKNILCIMFVYGENSSIKYCLVARY